MWPFIIEGDLVTVVRQQGIPRLASVVAVCIADQLIVHRVTGRTSRDGQVTIVVRGDSSPGSFARLQPGEIIGKVASVCRNGKRSTRWVSPPLSIVALTAGPVLRMLVRLKALF